MVIIKTASEIEKMRLANKLVAKVLYYLKKEVKPGITTLMLNQLAENITFSNNAVPAFKSYHNFPFSLCASVDDTVVHGFPNDTILKEGSILSLDFGVVKNLYFGDASITIGIGKISAEKQRLINITEECLSKGIEQAIPGNRIDDISFAIQEHAEKNGYEVVRDYVGHGIGRDLHEPPQVPNFCISKKRKTGFKLKAGMTLAIEPMLIMGKADLFVDKDGWTVKTKDKSLSAHFEHTVVISDSKPEILSRLD